MDRYEELVLTLKRRYSDQWRDMDDVYWLGRLLQEVSELALSLAKSHEHMPDHELAQIAAIAMNWIDLRGMDVGMITNSLDRHIGQGGWQG